MRNRRTKAENGAARLAGRAWEEQPSANKSGGRQREEDYGSRCKWLGRNEREQHATRDQQHGTANGTHLQRADAGNGGSSRQRDIVVSMREYKRATPASKREPAPRNTISPRRRDKDSVAMGKAAEPDDQVGSFRPIAAASIVLSEPSANKLSDRRCAETSSACSTACRGARAVR